MAPKKGVSQEEKKSKLLDFFNKEHTFYTLKEIEKDGSKYSKISSMVIKDILKELIDDGLVNVEKCGTTNLYWCFKYDKYKFVLKEHERLSNKIAGLREDLNRIQDQLQVASSGRAQKTKQGNRNTLLDQLEKEKASNQELEEQLETLKENDPGILNKLECRCINVRRCIEFYTDSIESMIYYFTRISMAPIEENVLRNEFGIPNEFEDLPISI